MIEEGFTGVDAAALTDLTADDLLTELDTRSVALATAIDPARRQAALDEILKPFQPGEMYAYVPKKEGVDPATNKYHEEEDRQAAFKLFHLEDFTRKVEPIAQALVAREQRAPGAEESLLARTRMAGLNLSDHLQVQVLDELRRIRLSPLAHSSPASAQLQAYSEALADPTDAYSSTLIRMIEAAHMNGFGGPKPEAPEERKAAQDLRKRIHETREGRVSESTRKLHAQIAEAKKQITRTKMLHKLMPANPAHPGAVKER